ncbi:MAG: hypothetical protein NVS1B14_02760 [Vulcanimicrobiaceae bacterium]
MTLRLSLFAGALLIVLAFAHPNSAPGASPMPKPTPVGLQYDEITRMAIPPATPIPVGAFQADYAAIINPSPESASGVDEEAAAAMKAMGIKVPTSMNSRMAGTLLRYAFFKGWIRVDDVVKHTAEIRKCDVHQFIQLDLQKKTYRIGDRSLMDQQASGAGDGAASNGSGTITMVMTRKGTPLGPQTIEGVKTNGFTMMTSMNITQATGGCGEKGAMSMVETQYVSGIHQPRAFCPMRATGMPYSASCKPTITNHASGAVPPSDRLIMYSKMGSLPPGSTDPNSVVSALVMERGNVKVLFLPDAQALFSIPADFTKE